MMHKAWSNIEEVPSCFSRSAVKFQGSTGQKIADFDLNWAFLDCNSSLNSPMALKWCLIKYRRDALLFSKVIHQISRSHRTKNSPCGCGDLSVRLGSRIIPHRHQVVVEVHWRGAQGWRSISWVVATFNHVGGSFNLSMAATGGVWIIPSFRIWGYVLHVEHISCVITNCGQHQWVIPSLFSIALEDILEENITRKLLSPSLDLFFKILLF